MTLHYINIIRVKPGFAPGSSFEIKMIYATGEKCGLGRTVETVHRFHGHTFLELKAIHVVREEIRGRAHDDGFAVGLYLDFPNIGYVLAIHGFFTLVQVVR